MFCLKIEKKTPSTRHGLTTPEAKTITIERGNFQLVAERDDMYSFFVREDSHIYMGESLTPISDDLIAELAERMAKGNYIDAEDNGILILVSVNLDRGHVDVFKSHSCERPLYYHKGDGIFFCSSRLHSFVDHGLKIELNREVLPEFYVYRFIMPPRTLFKDIGYLPGGWSLSIDMNEGNEELASLWQIDNLPRFGDLEGAVGKTAEYLRGSMRLLRDSGEKSILLLSGGLDSTILGAFCRESGLDIESISSGFHRITGDEGESDYARSAAGILNLRHSVYDIDEEAYLCALIDSIKMTGEPIHHLQSAVLGRLFSRGIEPEVKYLINGNGADSLFCSTMHYQYWTHRLLLKVAGNPLVKALIRRLSAMPSPIGKRFKYYSLDHTDYHRSMNHFIWYLGAYGDAGWVARKFGVGMENIVGNRMNFLDNFSSWSIMDKITILSFCGSVDEDMKIWGRLAEESGKKVIYPFTVPGLIRFAFSLSWDVKAEEPKFLLKRVAHKMGIPGEIINRQKRSFGFPIAFWALPGTLFQPLVEMAGEMFEKKELGSLQTMESPKAMILWGMLNLYIWHKIFVDNIDAAEIKREVLERHRFRKKRSV